MASIGYRRIIGMLLRLKGFVVVNWVRGVLIPLALLLGFPAYGAADEEPLDVEAILNDEPEPEDYVNSERCLRTARIRSVTALDNRHIVFRLSRGERYLMQLLRPCPGIRRNDTIIYESTGGGSICRNDSVRGTFGFGPGSRRLGPRCPISEFQRITPEQLDLLRESLARPTRE